jgi:hypothetical protein
MEEKSYSPGLEGVIAAETRISFLDVEREEIVIRGVQSAGVDPQAQLCGRRGAAGWRSSFPRRRGERSWRAACGGCGAPGRL